jgi:hypothetical protein
MEPEDSLPCSQDPITGPYSRPDNSVHSLLPHLYKIHFNIILPSTPILPSGPFPWGFSIKMLYVSLFSPTRVTCPAHLILLDFITPLIFDAQHKLQSCSICRYPHPHLKSTQTWTHSATLQPLWEFVWPSRTMNRFIYCSISRHPRYRPCYRRTSLWRRIIQTIIFVFHIDVFWVMRQCTDVGYQLYRGLCLLPPVWSEDMRLGFLPGI